MKKFVFTLLLITQFLSFTYAQDLSTQCMTKCVVDTSGIPKYQRAGWGGNKTAPVVIVYIDFPDGRYNDNGILKQPLNSSQLERVRNKDAAGEVGLTTVSNDNYVGNLNGNDLYINAAKYTYHDRWQMFFSSNGSYNETAHPDWSTHGDSAYGSFSEYWNEVSNGKFQIIPALTHPNAPTYELQRGILNNYIDLQNGRYIIDYLTMPKNKYGSNPDSAYFPNGAYYSYMSNLESGFLDFSRIDMMLTDAINEVRNNFPIFDVNNFMSQGGTVIFVMAGGHYRFKGKGKEFERYTLARGMSDTINCLNARIDGFGVITHEFAHVTPNLEWGHTNAGRYCIMNLFDVHDKNCPQHPSPFIKIQEGWLSPIPLEMTQDSVSLPPIETSHQCGILTVYGKPTATLGITTGEYYILENRRRLGFDRRIIRNDFLPSNPSDFKGGLLIWHYSPYGSVAPVNLVGISNTGVQLRTPTNDSLTLFSSVGNTNHFFGWKPGLDYEYKNYDSNHTYSSLRLKTGLCINDILNDASSFSGNISLNINYRINDPPNYSFVIYPDGTSNQTINLSGFVFVHGSNYSNKYIINGGTTIEGISSMGFSALKCYGVENNHITFNGAGYGNYRAKSSLGLSPLNNSILADSIVLNYCDLYNSSNISFYPGIYNNNISIEHFNLVDTSVRLTFNGDQTNPPHLSKYSNNNISKLMFTSKWFFDMDNDFLIPVNTRIENNEVCVANTDPTNIVFSPTTQSKILCNGKMDIKSDFFCNRDMIIGSNGELKISDCPSRAFETKIRFAENTGLKCYGKLTANANNSYLSLEYITFDKSDNGFWNGIICYNNSNSVSFNGVSIKNALTGIDASYTNPDNISILNSTFESNKFADIKLDNMNQSDAPGNISDNTFTGTTTQLFNVGMNNVSAMNINNNTFSDVYSTGISLFYCSNPVVTNNNINATTSPIAAPYAGIHCYQSFGFFGCNSPTNFFNGVLLDNSSPYFLNNEIWNNGYGMYLTNNSNPILSPSYSQTQSLYNAGYNKIYNNLYEEIYCNNEESSQISLPYIFKGFNSIYDDVNYGILINLNYALDPALDAQSNYWGGTPDDGMFSPEGSVNYSDYLNDPETTNECVPVLANENNDNLPQSVLLFGSANINDYSGNYVQASNKYKQYIGTTNNASKKQVILAKLFNTYLKSNLSFGELNTYLVGAANQYTTDTAFNRYATFLSIGSNVEQTLYPQAINEFQSIIDNSQLPNEVYYANIEKLRSISLMLDTLLNTGGGDNPLSYSNGQISNIINNILTTNYAKSNTTNINQKSTINDATRTKDNGIKKTTINDKGESINGNNVSKNDSYKLKQKNIDNIRGLLIPQNINTELLSNKELINLFEKVIEIKLFEQSLMNYTSANRPLNKIKPKYLIRKGNTFNDNLPTSYKLSQNYPNPFNPATKINFALPKQGFVTLKVYDIIGREIKTLVNEVKQAGYYTVDFNGSSLASGVYFYRIQSGDFISVKRMVLVK
jgi:M6 family metalloprotease-like protein